MPLSTRRKLCICAAAPLLVALALELGLRVRGTGRVPQPRVSGSILRRSALPELGVELVPGSRMTIEYPAEPGRAAWGVAIQVGPQGLRNAPIAASKPAGTQRILCLGDSHTLGHGVSAAETWPARLQELLDARQPGAYEVINAGVSSYDTAREVTLLEHRLLAFEPDLVLLQFYYNDVVEEPRAGAPPSDWVTRLSPSYRGWPRAWRERSLLVDWLADALWRRSIGQALAAEDARALDVRSSGWQRVRLALRRARRLSSEAGSRFAVLSFPLMLRSGDRLGGHAAAQVLGSFCAERAIPFFDGERDLLRAELGRLTVSRTDMHASPEAYLAFARSLAEWLAGADLL